MKAIDNMNAVKNFGLSRELTEFSQTEARVYNDGSDYNWAIQVFPPIERDDIMYFCIYNNDTDNIPAMWGSTKIARISMSSPEYITCTDSSKESWVLNDDEKDHLYDILTKNNMWLWNTIKLCYSDELEAYDGRKLNLDDLEMPDYRLLP